MMVKKEEHLNKDKREPKTEPEPKIADPEVTVWTAPSQMPPPQYAAVKPGEPVPDDTKPEQYMNVRMLKRT